MKLSTRGQYGTRALLDIALHYGNSPVPLKDVARRQEISVQYLEHLVSPLIKAGILRSTRGAGGGMTLAQSPEHLMLSKVIETLDGSVAPAECVDNPSICSRSSACVTRDVWEEVKRAITQVLESTTLQDLVERHNKKAQPKATMYHI